MAAVVLVPGLLRAQETTLLPTGARIAIAGDSITEQNVYSRYIETYLLACAGRRDVSVFQFGWSGQVAASFAAREVNDLNVFKPTVLTTCYGMNDGGYRLYEEYIGKGYEASMRDIVTKALGMGIKTVILGSPPAVDLSVFFRYDVKGVGGQYNDTLRQLGEVDRKLAAEYKMVFADTHTPMMEADAKAKTVLGGDYDIRGIHPQVAGHLIMAYAFLKAMGCSGDIGEITVNMKGGVTASVGHKVLSAAAGKVELESERYPFCFDPDPKSSSSNRSILPFIPFNQELNRFTLKVTNLASARAKVTWGGESKEFTGAQLASGINLAAEFSATPFDEAFQKVQQAVLEKQNWEISSIIGAEVQGTIKTLTQQLAAQHERLQAAVLATIVPVKYTITITNLGERP